MSGEKPNILEKPALYYDDLDEYPYQMRVSFEDGRTIVYERRYDQPHPIIIENVKIIRKWKQGYNNQPARRRRK